VAFPDESLSEGEQVRLHLRPHAIELFWPSFWAIVTIGGSVAAAIFLAGEQTTVFGLIGAVALILFIWLALAPYIVRRSTHYVFTSKQVLLRSGVFRRIERGIPLSKVNDVRTTQSLLDRVLRSGTLLIESAGEHGQSELHRVPNAIKVGNTLKDLVEHDTDRHQLDEDELRSALKEHREAGGAL
jgi:uncharacterized membrane protein YdbT with pleckstrin-like domain